jgi:AbrB family looped-hinge helix DNA binding protein
MGGMKKTITMSSKGQFTMPAEVRRALGINEGDTLVCEFDDQTQSLTLKKPMSIDDLRAMNKKILQRTPGASQAAKRYRSGDGFRAHVKKKYGA